MGRVIWISRVWVRSKLLLICLPTNSCLPPSRGFEAAYKNTDIIQGNKQVGEEIRTRGK